MSLLVLRSALIQTPEKIITGDLVIEEAKIKKIVAKYTGAFDQEINCTGLHILPGLIDTHVHLRDPGLTAKEDFETGTSAAVSGGVTTVFDMPNTNPPTITPLALKEKLQIAQIKAKANYNFFVGATRDNLQILNNFQNVAGIKVFVGSSTGNMLLEKEADLDYLFQNTKHLLAIHAEDEGIIQTNKDLFQNENYPAIHSKIRSPEAEIKAVERVLKLAQKYETRIHLCHISTKGALDLIEKYQLPNVTAEVSLHHLLLNEKDYAHLGNFAKVNPPLRTQEDNLALWEGLKKGVIQTIATDHAPHLKSEKEQAYANAPSGMPMVELTLALLLNQLNQGKITLQEIVQWTAKNPARIFKIQKKGQIVEGFDADLTLVDLKQQHQIENEKLWTKCKWSPFNGQKLTGKVLYTIVNGEIVFEKEKVKEGVFGKQVLSSSFP